MSAIEAVHHARSARAWYTPQSTRLSRLIRTRGAGAVGLDGSRLDPAILDKNRIALGAKPAKDGRAVKGNVQGFGEGSSRVAEEAKLATRQRCLPTLATPETAAALLTHAACDTHVGLLGWVHGFRPGLHPVVSSTVSTLHETSPRVFFARLARGATHTKGSLTETTNTWPTSLMLGCII